MVTENDDDYFTFNTMDEIIHNLWVGNLQSALDTRTLKEKGVCSVISVMKGPINLDKVRTIYLLSVDHAWGLTGRQRRYSTTKLNSTIQ